MVVQHNLRAMNSNRMLGLTASVQSKSTEKLSSGYKINRAADDAAGLSISEKMRKQIRGLSQASLNAADGISAVQTAEGALNEVQDMLQRMNELAVKAANGTMSEDDRSYIQNEIDQLVTEIDRVSETTKFNETYLLKGDGTEVVKEAVSYKDLGAEKEVVAKLTNADGKRVTTKAVTDAEKGMTTLNLGDLKDVQAGDSIVIDGITYNFKVPTAASKTAATENAAAVTAYTAGSGSIDILIGSTDATPTLTMLDSDAIAEELLKAIKGVNVKEETADVNKGNIEDISLMKDGDGNYNLNILAKTDVERATTTAATYKTDSGVQVKLEAGEVVADGDIITLGTVRQEAKLTNSIGQDVTLDTNWTGYEVNVEGYTGDATSFVYVQKDDLWEAQNADGTVTQYTHAELKELGIGLMSTDDTKAETEGLLNISTVNTKNFTGGSAANDITDGTTITIQKGFVVESSNTDLIDHPKGTVAGNSKISLESLNPDDYEIGDEIKVKVNVTKGGIISFDDYEEPDTSGIKALNFSLQVGADTTAQNKISIDIESMSAKALGIDGLRVDGKDSTNADAAVDVIVEAIQKVSTQRSALGAVQNRLEHTIANLDNVVENTTAAESQIRDTDMATEMVKYSNNNILAQAGQAMLAQANQANQGVLSLLG